MKRFEKAILIVVLLVLFPIKLNAKTSEESIQNIYDSVPNEISSILGDDYDLDSVLDIDNIFGLIFRYMSESFFKFRAEYMNFFAVSAVIFIYCSLCKTGKNGLSSVSETIAVLVCASSLFSILNGVVKSFSEKYGFISGFVSSLSAVTVTSMVSSASGNSASMLGTVCSVLIYLYNFMCSSFIIPFVNIYLAVNVCGIIFGDVDIRRLSSLVRNISVGVVSFFFVLFSGIMSVQSVISTGKDTLLKKSLKFVISNGLPVLGSAVADGVDTLFVSSASVKNSAGLLGMSVSFLYSLAPVGELVLCFAILTVVCFILGFFEQSSIGNFLLSARDIVSVLICIGLSLTVMTILMFYFIIKVV